MGETAGIIRQSHRRWLRPVWIRIPCRDTQVHAAEFCFPRPKPAATQSFFKIEAEEDRFMWAWNFGVTKQTCQESVQHGSERSKAFHFAALLTQAIIHDLFRIIFPLILCFFVYVCVCVFVCACACVCVCVRAFADVPASAGMHTFCLVCGDICFASTLRWKTLLWVSTGVTRNPIARVSGSHKTPSARHNS